MMNSDKMFSQAKLIFEGMSIEASPESLIVMARKELYVPAKKIILVDQATESEAMLLKTLTNSKGGLIL